MNNFHVWDNMSQQNQAINDSIQQILSPQFDFSNMNETIMQGAISGIASVFGNVYPDVEEMPYFNNMAMESIHIPGIFNHDKLLYNDNFMWHISNAYGSEAVVGIMAHEVGHAITNLFEERNGWKLNNWQSELCADYISGIYTRMAGLDPDPMLHSFEDECWAEDYTHPGGLLRKNVFNEGYSLVDQDPYLNFEIHDLHSILQHNVIGKYTQPEIDSFETGVEFQDKQPEGQPRPKPVETIGDPAFSDNKHVLSERFPGQDTKIPFTSGAGICNFKCGQSGCAGLISISSPSSVDYSVGSQA